MYASAITVSAYTGYARLFMSYPRNQQRDTKTDSCFPTVALDLHTRGFRNVCLFRYTTIRMRLPMPVYEYGYEYEYEYAWLRITIYVCTYIHICLTHIYVRTIYRIDRCAILPSVSSSFTFPSPSCFLISVKGNHPLPFSIDLSR